MNTKAWIFLLIGVTLATTLFSMVQFPPPKVPSPSSVQSPRRIIQEQVPRVTGTEPLSQIFTKAGCPVCHTIPGIPGAFGKVGPPLTLQTSGPRRLADPRYKGTAESVKEYIIESILNPSVYVVEGYPDRTMPTWYDRKLTALALEKIATYLESRSSKE